MSTCGHGNRTDRLAVAHAAFRATEVIGMPDGSIGEQLQQAKIYLNTPDLLAWTVVIILVSLGFEKLFLALVDWAGRRLERM